MMLSYRARRNWKRAGAIAVALVALAVVALICWMLWVNRYIVYTQDGVRLDFDLSPDLPWGERAEIPVPDPSLPVIYDDTPINPDTGTAALTRLDGYYVDLTADVKLADVRAQLEAIPRGSTVLMEVKTFWGVSLYSSTVVTHVGANAAAVDELISWAKDRFYLIAQVPAFRDYWFGRENQQYGLLRKGGPGSLWDDADKCYWLNPAEQGSISNLIRVATELRNKGFREVVFSDFCFPNTDQIIFDGDRLATLNRAAADIVNTCAGENFIVSFMRSDTAMTLPQGYTRLYLEGIAAVDVEAMGQAAIVSDRQTQVVFLAPSGDTRYDLFSVLRPLELAQS